MGRRLRKYARWLKRTPFHPQWLMRGRKIDAAITRCTGVILDIGAADRWLRSCLQTTATYIALDYPSTAIGLYGTRPDVFGDACKLPFADASIDAVACYEVMEHVQDPEAVVSEISRVLVPGGVVEFSMPFLYPVHDAPHDYQRWTRYGWTRSLRAAGLEVDAIEAVNHPLHAAAVLACLSLAGPLQRMRFTGLFWRVPLILVAMPTINLSAVLLSLAWPQWEAMTTGHRVLARKMP